MMTTVRPQIIWVAVKELELSCESQLLIIYPYHANLICRPPVQFKVFLWDFSALAF